MNSPTDRVGVTTGLDTRCDRATHSVEQVYVRRDKTTQPSHPILIEGWIGYGVAAQMRVSRSQAIDLIGLLAKAIG